METLAKRKFDWINERLADGMTVQLATRMRATQITPKTAKSWAESGRPFFKLNKAGDALLILERGKYVDATACKVSAF